MKPERNLWTSIKKIVIVIAEVKIEMLQMIFIDLYDDQSFF